MPAQRARAMGVARPLPPPSADVRPPRSRLCPVHVKPQCEPWRLARREVAHCCERGHAGHPPAVAGQRHLHGCCRRGWHPWSHHRSRQPSATVWRRYRRRRAAASGRTAARPAHRHGAARCKVLCLGWGIPPPRPDGIQQAPQQGVGGGGTGGEPQWLQINGSRRAATPPPPSPDAGALGGNTALGGRARGRAPHERRFFRDIARADVVLGTPPPPRCAARERGREEEQAATGGATTTGRDATHPPSYLSKLGGGEGGGRG